MTPEEPETLTAEQELARSTVRELETPSADPAYRHRLKFQFIAGELASPRGRAPARPAADLGWLRRPALRWVAAAAAAVVVVAVAGTLNRGPSWTLASVSGQGVAVVDGLPVPVTHRQDLERLMKPGVRLRVPEGVQMVLMARGAMVMQATPGTDVTLPKPPGRWFGRSSQGEVRAGEVRLTTGPRFRGARLALTTPEAQVHVTGTTLAVICDPEGTCVCVLEGHVMVGRREGPMAGVDGGRRRFVYNDDREPEAAEMRPVEAEQLALLRQQSAPMLEPSGR